MKNLKVNFLGDWKFKVQENNNWRFGKSQIVDLWNEFMEGKDFNEVIETVKVYYEEMYGKNYDHLLSKINNPELKKEPGEKTVEETEEEEEETTQFTDIREKIIDWVVYKKGRINIAVSSVILLSAPLIMYFSPQPKADIRNENIETSKPIKESKIWLLKNQIISLENTRVKELELQKELRSKREKERMEWNAREKNYDEMINKSKKRVSKIDDDVFFYKSQSVEMSKNIELTGVVNENVTYFELSKK